MRRRMTELAVAAMVLVPVAIATRSQAAIDDGPVYVLGERATYQSGCFPPCL